MRFGSLFAGIGGLDLGLERAGMECAWQVEIDPFCQKVLSKHWPEVPKYGDVRELSGSSLPPVDLICGGFPCQPVSTAGRRQGTKDPRWLWPQFARLVGEMGPRYVLVENVPGLLTKGGTEVLADLAEMGFDAEWGVVAAAHVGAPHIRERVFVIAYPSSGQLWVQSRGLDGARGQGETEFGNDGTSRSMADSNRVPNRRLHRGRQNRLHQEQLARDGEDVADPKVYDQWSRLRARGPERIRNGRPGDGGGPNSNWWAVEPGMGRVVNGLPGRVDRLRALGNAVVPQWAELIGSMILNHAREV